MALIKTVDTDSGVAAAYWRIVRMDVDLKARSVWFLLDGYVSQDARAADKAPVLERPVAMPLPHGMGPENLTRTALYTYAKGLEAFAGAVDA